jgi:hypothetical protein
VLAGLGFAPSCSPLCSSRLGRFARGAGFLCGEQVGDEGAVLWHDGDVGFAGGDVLGFERLEHGVGNLAVLRDSLERGANDLRAHCGGPGELDGGLAGGGANGIPRFRRAYHAVRLTKRERTEKS